MVGVVAADEAGIGLVAGRSAVDGCIEGIGFRRRGLPDLVRLFGVGSTGSRSQGEGNEESWLHDRLEHGQWAFGRPGIWPLVAANRRCVHAPLAGRGGYFVGSWIGKMLLEEAG